ncbi:DUF302 domain-containing protein [Paraburkholderia sp. BCC1884]|uniref:DUF302 domain-containing protein n=1 Tax=Paraburkholderia sp. BCC1884 TaxID=2562668 RepID=UPI001C90FCD7|nr:DUF302 domain-containing protein [Paraburkholderia sp. BCC1884]
MHVEKLLTWNVEDEVHTTAKKIEKFLTEAGVTVFAVIDQQQYARSAGLTMDPLVEILFGNPRVGTPLMQANPISAFDLPLKVLVISCGGNGATVKMLRPEILSERYGCTEALADMVVGGAAKLVERAVRGG